MLDHKLFEDLAEKIMQVFPPGLQQMQQDVKKNVQTVLQTMLGKLDLVTREEFDVQSELLARTTEKVIALEQHLAQLDDSSAT